MGNKAFLPKLGLWPREIADALTSLFFPAGCRICDQLLLRASRIPICEACLDSFEKMPERICSICGHPFDTFSPALAAEQNAEEQPTLPYDAIEAEEFVCGLCRNKTYEFARARSYGLYKDTLVRALLLQKFERMDPLADWFAKRLVNLAQREREILEADVVVPVPLHKIRRKERGHNQADLIARPLAKRLGLDYNPALLTRNRPRPDKHILTYAERWESVRGAFAIRAGKRVDKLRVLLVDDVMTTGATLDACARALRKAGAKSVIGLTVARAEKRPVAGS